VSRTSLLVLDARDVHILMDQEPTIARRIQETAQARVEPESLEPRGDIAEEGCWTRADASARRRRLSRGLVL
jgi:voltage-gated potassium channel